MADIITTRYLMPPLNETEEERKGFLLESRQQGESYLKGNRAWPSVQRGADVIADHYTDPSNPSLSRVRYALPKRAVKEIVATLSNIRLVPNYRTFNDAFQAQGNLLNKRFRAWFADEHVGAQLKKCLQWAAACGKGYGVLHYGRRHVVTGPKDIYLDAKGPESVIPVQMGEDHNLQQAYQVHIVHQMPYFEAAMRFPTQTDWLMKSAKSPSVLKRGGAKRWVSNVMRIAFGGSTKEQPETFPLVELIETYTLDTSLNTTGEIMKMGTPGTNWEYYVYPRGGRMPSGVFDPTDNRELEREVRDEEALLFPARRVTWWDESHIYEDGPSHWWHGYVPLIEFAFDEWPFDFLGYPLTRDLLPLARSIREGLRVLDDVQNVKTRPPYAFLKNRVARNLVESLDPRVPLQAVGVDGMTMGDLKNIITPIFPANYYQAEAWQLELLKENERRIDRLSGVADAIALTKMRQMPSADSLEKIGEMLGPVIGDMSRSMEKPMTDLGVMMLSNFLQFDSVAKRLEILGEGGFTKEDVDYDPANLIPAPDRPTKRLMTIFDRGRAHAQQFTYQIAAGSLHQITTLTRRLMMWQLYARTPGFPVDPWSLGESMDINIGSKPENAESMVELYFEWQLQLAKMQKAIADEVGANPQQATGPRGGAAKTGGRPPTGHAAGQFKQRTDGSSVVQTSR
jgi:hypothetical protein